VYVILTQSLAVQILTSAVFVIYKLLFLYLVLVPWLERVDSQFVVIFSVVLLNMIVVPILATLAVDVACFESLFLHARPIVTNYAYSSCVVFTGTNRDDATCLQYADSELEVSIPAPFIYSDMCFTAVLTNYIPIYVLTYGVIGLLIPIIQIVTTIHFANAAVTQNSEMLAWIHRMKRIEWFPIFYMFPLESVGDMVTPDGKARQHFYLGRFNSLNCVLLLTLLVTFGVTYAPLALMLLLNIVLTTIAFQMSIYYHAEQVKFLPPECMEPWVVVLKAEIRDMHKVVFGSRTAIYVFSSVFIAAGLYEMAEVENFALAISLMVVIFAITVAGTRLLKYRRDAWSKRAKLAESALDAWGSAPGGDISKGGTGRVGGEEDIELSSVLEANALSKWDAAVANVDDGSAGSSTDVHNPMTVEK
jgi:hypothetical protein